MRPTEDAVAALVAAAKQGREQARPQRSDDYDMLLGRLRDASQAMEAARDEQTALMAWARLFIVPPPSYAALAEASGLSYSGVRQRLTPQVLAAVKRAGRSLLDEQMEDHGRGNGS